MFIEKWKDTAFGNDYGSDFREFLERIPAERLTFKIIFDQCNLNKYFDFPELINKQISNKVIIENSFFDQYVHYEDAVIALAVIVVESELNGSADLTNVKGSKKIIIDVAKSELVTLRNAVTYIYENHEKFKLFEMNLDDYILVDIAEIIVQLKICIDSKYRRLFLQLINKQTQ